jgi:hypothetical protein
VKILYYIFYDGEKKKQLYESDRNYVVLEQLTNIFCTETF